MSICTRRYCILHHHILTVWKRKKPVLVKNSFDQNINTHTICLLLPEGLWLSSGKAPVRLVELWAKLTAFSWNSVFICKNDWWTMVIQCWVFGNIFSKMNKVCPSLQGKQLTAIVAHGKIRAFKWKLEFWKTCLCHPELPSFPALKDFLNEIRGNVNFQCL